TRRGRQPGHPSRLLMPALHLLAGPDGAGKSSYAHDVLVPVTSLPFINADEIAAEKWPTDQVEHAYEAARIAEARRRATIAEGSSFVSETVFSHPGKVDLVADAVARATWCTCTWSWFRSSSPCNEYSSGCAGVDTRFRRRRSASATTGCGTTSTRRSASPTW